MVQTKMGQNSEDLRKMFREAELPVSFISWVIEIDDLQLRDFFDGKTNSLTSEQYDAVENLLNPDEVARLKNSASNSAILDGIGCELQRHSVAFFFEGSNGEPELASGTLVQVGESVFVATAGHAIRKTKVLQFIGDNRAGFEADFSDPTRISIVRGGSNIKVRRWGKHPKYDVGFFELTDGALEKLAREPIGLERVATRKGQYGRNTFVYGYPSQIARLYLHNGSNSAAMQIGSITYEQPLLAPFEWPAVPKHDLADESVDCFVRYSVDDEMITLMPTGKFRIPLPPDLPDNLPDAYGMSGGGLWQSWLSKDAIWSPSSYELIAIQSRWSRDREYLRAIQISHWLELIQNKCPELRELISPKLGS